MLQKGGKWVVECNLIIQLLAEFPELMVTQKWGADVYTYNGANVVSYGGFKHFFSVWFYNGVFLEDKLGVLVNASEGKTKSLRQWRFTNVNEMETEKIKAYVEEAILIEKKGMKIAPAKFKPEPLPEILLQKLDEDPHLQAAFRKLTPGRQKEYALHINEAKQEITKAARLEKIVPMILNGKGLNDKYKGG